MLGQHQNHDDFCQDQATMTNNAEYDNASALDKTANVVDSGYPKGSHPSEDAAHSAGGFMLPNARQTRSDKPIVDVWETSRSRYTDRNRLKGGKRKASGRQRLSSAAKTNISTPLTTVPVPTPGDLQELKAILKRKYSLDLDNASALRVGLGIVHHVYHTICAVREKVE